MESYAPFQKCSNFGKDGREGFAKNVTKREGGVSMKRYVAKSANKYIGKIGK